MLRGEMQRNRDLRVKLRKAIMNSIAGANERGGDVSVGMELDVSTSWRHRTRKIKNNLGLVYIGSDLSREIMFSLYGSFCSFYFFSPVLFHVSAGASRNHLLEESGQSYTPL